MISKAQQAWLRLKTEGLLESNLVMFGELLMNYSDGSTLRWLEHIGRWDWTPASGEIAAQEGQHAD